MGCLGCKPLTLDRSRVTSNVTITATGGFGLTEITRVYVPPSAEPLAIHADVAVAATTSGETTSFVVVVCPVTAFNLLGAVGGRGVPSAPAPAQWAYGIPIAFTAWPPDGQVWPPGDYILAAQRGANAGHVLATTLMPSHLWVARA